MVSVLEGGYSDRALTSGAMAHLAGMTDLEERGIEVSKDWWSVENLIKVRTDPYMCCTICLTSVSIISSLRKRPQNAEVGENLGDNL